MFREDLRALLTEQANIPSDWNDGIELCQNREADLICAHIDEAVDFLHQDCTAEEFAWLSEIFGDVALRSRSRAFVQAARALLSKYPEESQQYDIESSVAEAEDILQDIEENPGWYRFQDDLRDLIRERSKLSPKDEPAILQCNGKMADLLCTHMAYAADYLRSFCSDEEYVWVSEVFPEVAQRSQSPAFVQVIRTLPGRYPRETRRYDILQDIKAAELALKKP